MHATQILPFQWIAFGICVLITYYSAKKYRNTSYWHLFVVILFSLVPIISIFRPGSYESGDLTIHVMKAMDFYQSLTEGVIFPRWAGSLNAGYGYPHFIFAYPLPYYLIALFHTLGLSFVFSAKILLAVSFIGSGLTMYWWMSQKFSKNAGLVSALLYLYAPYHLVDLHFRVAIGEVVSFVFIPLVSLAIDQISNKKSIHWILLGGVSYGALILSHQATAMFASLFFISYILLDFWRNRNVKTLFKQVGIFIIGLGISAFHWMAILSEKLITKVPIHHDELLHTSLSKLLSSPWRWGFLFQSNGGQLSFVIGYVQLAVVAILIWSLFQRRIWKNKIQPLFWLGWLGMIIFLISPYSAILWKWLPLLNQIQFTYRLLILVNVITAVIGGILYSKKIWSDKVWFGVMVLMMLSTALNWANRTTILDHTDSVLRSQIISSAPREVLTPAIPIWFDTDEYWADPVNQKINASNMYSAKQIINEHHLQKYQIEALSPPGRASGRRQTKVVYQTLFYPGWEVFIDGNPTEVLNSDGLISFYIPQGEHQIMVQYVGSVGQRLGEVITIFSLFGLASFWILSTKLNTLRHSTVAQLSQ